MPNAALYQQARERLAGQLQTLQAATRPTAKLDAANAVMGTLATLAANAPTESLRAEWLQQYRALQPDAAALRVQINSDEAPGAVLLALDKFSDAVLKFGGQVLEGAGGVIAAAPGVLRATPVIIIVALIAAAVIAVAIGPKLFKRKK